MATPERVQRLQVRGVDRRREVRLDKTRASSKWYKLKNLYPERVAHASKRPGSVWLTETIHVAEDFVEHGSSVPAPLPADWSIPTIDRSSRWTGQTLPVPQNDEFTSIFRDIFSEADDVLVGANAVSPNRITGLQHLLFDIYGDEQTIVGSISWGKSNPLRLSLGAGKRDVLFYTALKPGSTTETAIFLADVDPNIITSRGAYFDILPIRFGITFPGDPLNVVLESGRTKQGRHVEWDDTEVDLRSEHFAVVNNGQDALMTYQVTFVEPRESLAAHQREPGKDVLWVGPVRTPIIVPRPKVFALTFYDSEEDFQSGAVDKDPGYGRSYFEVRDIANYRGQLVLGGFSRTANGMDGDVEDMSEFVAFSDIDRPGIVGVNANIRIGDAKDEPVIAVDSTAVPTDVDGLKGQLVAFTSQKSVLISGLPPQSGEGLEGGSGFASTVLGKGTWSKRAVVRTNKGLVFLGTDGTVYVADPLRGLIAIGRPVESVFRGLTEEQLANACATYYDDFYVISAPEGNNTFNSQTWVCDMRNYNPRGKIDFGVEWWGPWEGIYPSVMAVTRGDTGSNALIAGSSIEGKIYQLWMNGTLDDANSKRDAGTDPVPIEIEMEMNRMDQGLPHRDKEITAVSCSIEADRATGIDVILEQHSSDQCAVIAEEFDTESVVPCGAQYDTAGDVFDSARFGTGDAFMLKTWEPSDRFVGRMCKFRVTEDLTNPAKVAFTDFEVRYIIQDRRSHNNE